MTILDRVLLGAAGLVAVLTIIRLIGSESSRGSETRAKAYHITSLAVLLVSGLLLILNGWGILGLMGESLSNRLVAIVATLIPFAWAAGVVTELRPRHEVWYLPLLATGLVLIAISRFVDAPVFSRIVYPVFHGTAGVTVILAPIIAYTRRDIPAPYLLVSVAGFLISSGGLALSFLLGGRQLLFFSTDVVLSVLAPLLLVTTVLYSAGILLSASSRTA